MKKGSAIVIISIGFLISVISPYTVLLLGLPIFSLGLIFIWSSEGKLQTKLIWTLVPPILWMPATALWLFIYNSIGVMNAQKRDYYVNYDFRGEFTIVESKCGSEPIIKDDRFQFEIPENGIFLFNSELKSGHIDRRVFQRTIEGDLVEIKDNLRPTPSEDKDTIGHERIIGIWGGAFGSRTNQSNQKSKFISINIETNKVYSEQESWRLSKHRENKLDSLIINCDQ